MALTERQIAEAWDAKQISPADAAIYRPRSPREERPAPAQAAAPPRTVAPRATPAHAGRPAATTVLERTLSPMGRAAETVAAAVRALEKAEADLVQATGARDQCRAVAERALEELTSIIRVRQEARAAERTTAPAVAAKVQPATRRIGRVPVSRDKVIAALPGTSHEIAERTGLTLSAVKNALQRAKQDGLAVPGPGHVWRAP